VEEAGELLGISRALAYEMARTGRLPTLRFGKRIVVPKKAIETMLDRNVSGAVHEQV
jgi:excisionase family DNA binding protein